MNETRDAEYVEFVQSRLAWLRQVAYLLCQDWQSADDLVQVAITRLFAHWPRVRRMDNMDGYVRTILLRAFLSDRRSWRGRVTLVSSPPDKAAPGADHDMAMDVRQALAAVPARQRTTLVLRFYCDLDVEQTAAALGCSAGTPKGR